MSVLHAPSDTAKLTAAMEVCAPHLRPILAAVRDHRAGMLFVPPGRRAFQLPAGRPAIVMIGDDMDVSKGPDGFHGPSIRRAIKACRAFAVVACEPLAAAYGGVAGVAATGGNAMLVETRPEHEMHWIKLILELAPGKPLLVCTVKGGNA
ncbi:hypothetical protein [Sphingomonas montanisoli]|uniref:Uncharacterized protein n=1 Tax=Sphingomonas montanisoli TaxID=2606412 RepID=A0A5D9C2K3_9SPHN|nr:hypothetical protein [Sphingomonas montanisoli]TZG25889.1 hypothetical protein FYJ91_12990 [Sphingomonas montanisoli]